MVKKTHNVLQQDIKRTSRHGELRTVGSRYEPLRGLFKLLIIFKTLTQRFYSQTFDDICSFVRGAEQRLFVPRRLAMSHTYDP
jgi:hypothetical protein